MKMLYAVLIFFISTSVIRSQSISEKEIFNLTYKGEVNSYNFVYDNESSNYCYVYVIPDEGKSFIISKKGLSDKYDYIAPEEIKFDSKGNYYAVTSDYKEDYGINNYFLIVNGNVIKSYSYIEAYSSYFNKKNEYVFIFKEKDLYKIGYYSPGKGFRQSDAYDNIRTAFNYKGGSDQMEGDMIAYKDEDFYHNDKGERAFIATKGGRSKIIFETSELQTDYSDINESSLTTNRNNELSFIAKKGGRFYETGGNEFAVSGKKEYKKFDLATAPLLFNKNNEPVYIAGDSVTDFKTEYFLVIGDQNQSVYMDEDKTVPAPSFSYIISEIKLSPDGNVTYIAAVEEVVKGKKLNPQDEDYDQYYTRSFLVKDGIANELGYNVNQIKYSDKNDMLYTGIADIDKKEYLLLLNYGKSRLIINKNKYDDMYDYGFAPTGEIYYAGQIYEDPDSGKISEATLFLGDKQIGKYRNLIYQGEGKLASVLQFDSKNNYSFVAEEKIDSLTNNEFIVKNNERLPFPENVSGSKNISYISSLMYTKDDKLFFIGDMIIDPVTYDVTKEIFVNNRSLGKIYNSVFPVKYDEQKNEITFTAARGKKIYFVTVKM